MNKILQICVIILVLLCAAVPNIIFMELKISLIDTILISSFMQLISYTIIIMYQQCQHYEFIKVTMIYLIMNSLICLSIKYIFVRIFKN
jgi:hypothetical protein